MKRFFRIIFIIAVIVIFFSCGSSENNNVTGFDSTSSQTVGGEQSPPDSGEVAIIQNALQWSKAEVGMSQLAMQKASNPRIKDLANTVIADQQSSNQELSVIAKNRNLAYADSLTDMRKDESGKGAYSDQTYVNALIKNDEKAIGNFKDALNKNKNNSLQSWISHTLERTQKHLDSAKAILPSIK